MTIHIRLGAAVATALLALTLATAGIVTSLGSRSSDRTVNGSRGDAGNVILLIGDGLGDAEVSAARYYQYGAEGRLAMDDMPARSTVTTYAIEESNPEVPNYVPDSAATATAWSTGTKTSNGRIATSARTDEDLVTIMELAKEAGLLVGNVSTARLTDSTPAAAMAHVMHRVCQGPANATRHCPQDATENGGPGSIAEQSINLRVDVLLGGGRDRYGQAIAAGEFEGQTVVELAANAGYTMVRRGDDLAAVDQLPVLGLFAEGHLPPELTGPKAVPGGVQAACSDNPAFNDAVPTLAEMTAAATELLDIADGADGNARAGLFLQVEGGLIDKRSHSAEPCQQIGESVAFDRAVEVALDYAERDRNTTVIVSADHTHAIQIIAASNRTSPGSTATLTTADGRPLQLNCATAGVPRSQEHTGGTTPYLSYGPAAGDVPAVIDQTEVFDIITGALGLRVDR